MGQYRIEISPNNRATCKNKDCKDQAIKLVKGEPRFGTFVEINGAQSWAYKHWGCVTPAQIKNIKDSIEEDLDLLDGYDEVPNDLQERIRRALDQGHVDDADWRGDVEMNRPGMRGTHKRTPKKKAQEEDEGKPGDASPKKAASKKRGRAKKEDEFQEPPAAKRPEASSKHGKEAVKSEDENLSEPAAKKKKKPASQKGRTAPSKKDIGSDIGTDANGLSETKDKHPRAVKDEAFAQKSTPRNGRSRKTHEALAEEDGDAKDARKTSSASLERSDDHLADEPLKDAVPRQRRAGRKELEEDGSSSKASRAHRTNGGPKKSKQRLKSAGDANGHVQRKSRSKA
ncbi:MAG: hypothetical protein M1837_005940 [Sclerophora amabilis]|nr:MAG: hypothetical protein M1837_005940 [Sclerophora amabilis]